MTVPAVRTLRDEVLDVLRSVANLKVYDGEIRQDDPPPLIPGSDRVLPYAVLYAGAGRGDSDRLVGHPSFLDWSGQITVAAGYAADCLAAVDRIRAALVGRTLTLPDGRTGYVREIADLQIRVDEQVRPPRHWVPLIIAATASE